MDQHEIDSRLSALLKRNEPRIDEEAVSRLVLSQVRSKERPSPKHRRKALVIVAVVVVVLAGVSVGIFETVNQLRGPAVIFIGGDETPIPAPSGTSAKTIHIDPSAAPANAQASTVVRLSWRPSTVHPQNRPEASAVFGVSPDGKTIAIAEAPDRNSRTLHLYDATGTPLLTRQLLANTPHDSPFVALTDLTVVSPTDILLLLQHEDSFRVHRLTPNETGMSTEGVLLIHGSADQLAVPDPSGSDVWAYDGATDRSYPIFLGGKAIWQDVDQQGKAREGIPLGDAWVQMKREDARITLTGPGSAGAWSVQIPAPRGERFQSARLLQPDASGLFYLVTEIVPTSVGYSPGVITILCFTADGTNLGQLTLNDLRSSVAPQFAVTSDGTLYALESRPGALVVVTYSREAWAEAVTTETTSLPTTTTGEIETDPDKISLVPRSPPAHSPGGCAISRAAKEGQPGQRTPDENPSSLVRGPG